MSVDLHTRLLASLFASKGLSAAATLRLADAVDAELAIWPYAVDIDQAQRNRIPPTVAPPDRRPDPVDASRTYVLVVPSSIDALDRATRLVIDNPVLALDKVPVRVSIQALAPADLAALFLAGRAEYRAALAAVIG